MVYIQLKMGSKSEALSNLLVKLLTQIWHIDRKIKIITAKHNTKLYNYNQTACERRENETTNHSANVTIHPLCKTNVISF